jgi:hypothetical protein
MQREFGVQAHIGRQPVFFSDAEIDFRPEYVGELRELDVPVTAPARYFLITFTAILPLLGGSKGPALQQAHERRGTSALE